MGERRHHNRHGDVRGSSSIDDRKTLTIVGVSQDEGTGGATTAFNFVVTLSNPIQGGLSFQVQTVDGTALDGTAATTANDDYQAQTKTLFFAGTPGEQQTFTVLVNRDNRYELDEQFSVALSDATALGVGVLSSNIAVLGSPATGTIANDDTDIIETGTGLDDTRSSRPRSPRLGTFQITTDGVAGPVISFSGVTSLTFSGLDGDDVLIIEHPATTYFSPERRGDL